MKFVVSMSVLIALSIAARAQFIPPEASAARSVSGQFVVHSSKEKPTPVMGAGPADTNDLISLQPSFVAISCERIKKALMDQLAVSDRWSGKIFVELHPGVADEPITVACNRFKNGWNYQVYMPETVERRRFMCAIVQTILLEMANRSAGGRSAEVPAWLTEGLVQQLLESHETELLLPPPSTAVHGILVSPTVIEKRRTDEFEKLRRTLREHPQLTLEQLSWPTEAQLAGADGGVYRCSAQLFVAELLRLKDGRTCMTSMIGELARYYNWQTAFLRAFKAHFARPLDLEKWWALQVVHVTGRERAQFWTLEESRQKLDEILMTPAQVRAAASDMPLSMELNLQTVITEWDFARQKRALGNKVQTLGLMRLWLAPEWTALADDYREVLEGYLKRRARATFTLPVPRSPTATAQDIVRETVRKLDALDEKRTELKLEPARAAVQ